LAGATWRAGFATLGFLVAFGLAPVAVAWAVAVSSVIVVFMCSPLAAIFAVTTSITPVAAQSKQNLEESQTGDGMAMGRSWFPDDRG